MNIWEIFLCAWSIIFSWLMLGWLGGWLFHRKEKEKMPFLDWVICIVLGAFTLLVSITLLAHEWFSKQDKGKNDQG